MFSPGELSSIFVVVPAYREEGVIGGVVDDLLQFGYKVVVVDDGSPTNLASLLRGKAIFFLRHPVNLGQGAALQTGIDFALLKGASFIATFDADAQHQATDIRRLLTIMHQSNADVVLGSRFLSVSSRQMPASRRLLLQLARVVNFFFTGLYLTDAHNGLRLLNRKAAETIVLKENRMAHATEILGQIRKHCLRYVEAPVQIVYSGYSLKKGQTSWSGFRILIDLLLHKILP